MIISRIFKLVVKTIARNMVFYATFMAKLNMVLLVAVCTVTCLSSLKKEMHSLIQRIHVVSGILKTYYFLGGLMKHAYNYTAIINPTVNSTNIWFLDYKKLPVSIAWW